MIVDVCLRFHKTVALSLVNSGDLRLFLSTERSSSYIEPIVASMYDDASVGHDHVYDRIADCFIIMI